MQKLKETAELYRVGLISGFINIDDVIAWADSVIEVESSPDPGILEVSVSRNKCPEDVAHELEKVCGICDLQVPIRQLLKLMHEAVTRDQQKAGEIAGALRMMAQRNFVPDAEAEWKMFYLLDAFADAHYGYYSLDQAIKAIVKFLQSYAD